MGRRRLAHGAWIALAEKLAAIWQGIREASGDAAYENYLRAAQRGHTRSNPVSPPSCGQTRAPLSRREFYLESLRRRYSGISRCC